MFIYISKDYTRKGIKYIRRGVIIPVRVLSVRSGVSRCAVRVLLGY